MDFRSNTVVIPSLGLVFFIIEKCASTSIKRALRAALEVPGRRWPDRLAEIVEIDPRPWEREDWQSLLSITIVRDPLDRLASTFFNKIRPDAVLLKDRSEWMRPGMSFDAFARGVCARPDRDLDRHLRGQLARMSAEHLPSRIFRFERLAEDWQELQAIVAQRSGLMIPELGHANPWRRDRDPYTPELRELVARRYRKDMETFGYAQHSHCR